MILDGFRFSQEDTARIMLGLGATRSQILDAEYLTYRGSGFRTTLGTLAAESIARAFGWRKRVVRVTRY